MVQVRVGAVVAAGSLASALTLQALDETVLLLKLLSQPKRRRRRNESCFVFNRTQQLDFICDIVALGYGRQNKEKQIHRNSTPTPKKERDITERLKK